MSSGRSLRRLWRHRPYVVVAAALLLASSLVVVGGTFASFTAETENQTATVANGWLGTPTNLTATPSGYDGQLTWAPGTHGLDGQQLWSYDNGASSSCSAATLSSAITSSATSISVSSAAGFPSSGSYSIGVDGEQMTVTGGQGTTTWTVTRGVNGTTAAAHSAGATVSAGGLSATMASATTASYTDSHATNSLNGHDVCYRMVSTRSGGNWTASASFGATQLGLVATNVSITNHGTSGRIDKTDVVVLTFNQQTNYPTTSQTVTVCAFTSGAVILGDTRSGGGCGTASDTYSIGELTLNGGTVGANDIWSSSTAIASTSAPWTITVTLGASGNSHVSTLTSPTTWTLTPSTSLLSSATTDQATACTSATYNCTPTTSGGGF